MASPVASAAEEKADAKKSAELHRPIVIGWYVWRPKSEYSYEDVPYEHLTHIDYDPELAFSSTRRVT